MQLTMLESPWSLLNTGTSVGELGFCHTFCHATDGLSDVSYCFI